MYTILCYMGRKTDIIRQWQMYDPKKTYFMQNYNYPSRNTKSLNF